jgi:hypothetical protein
MTTGTALARSDEARHVGAAEVALRSWVLSVEPVNPFGDAYQPLALILGPGD